MRIVAVNQFYAPMKLGGAEVSVQMLCEALAASGHEMTLVTSSVKGSPEREAINGVNVRRINAANIYAWEGQKRPAALRALWHGIDVWNPLVFRHVHRALREIQPDVLHTNNLAGISCSAWSAAKSLGIPVVHTLRDYYLLCPRSTMFRGEKNCIEQCASCQLMGLPKRWATPAVSGVVGISEFVLRRHKQTGLFASAQVSEVIPNPAPASMKEDNRNANGRGLALGFLGRLEPAKGIEVLLKTLADHDFCGWAEVVVGGGGADDYTKDLRHRYNDARVKFTGYLDPESFFRQVDLLVVPSSWNEPFGRVVVEAYAHGVPVVASNRGGLPELVEDGSNGFIFEPDSRDSLQGILVRLASEAGLLKHLQRGAKAKVANYTPSAVASAYEHVFAKVIDRRSVSS
jgi:glycosyltransferase involved in cell wall biosynthesis